MCAHCVIQFGGAAYAELAAKHGCSYMAHTTSMRVRIRVCVYMCVCTRMWIRAIQH